MFICPLCGKTFNARDILDSHIFSHTKGKPHKCLTCSQTFPWQSSLYSHTKSFHSAVKIKNLQCPECSYKCNEGTRLKRHLRTHSAELPFSCTVPSCGFKTKHKNCLARHTRGVHSRQLTFKCKSGGCNYKTSTKENLDRHLKNHSDERPFECSVPGCKYTCKTKELLKVHTNGVHSDGKRWKCSTCEFRTKHKSYLRTHQAAHSATKRLHCQALNCRYACDTKMDLVMHFDRKHRKKDVLCTEPGCQYRCGSAALLTIHLKDHKLPILKCPVGSCAYSTRLKSNLRYHNAHHHDNQQGVSLVVSRQPNPAHSGQTQRKHDAVPFPIVGIRLTVTF